MREWIKNLSEIDVDCVHRYEYLLGRPLRDRAEYQQIDEQVDEMVLEWNSRKDFFAAYPTLEAYRKGREKDPTVMQLSASRKLPTEEKVATAAQCLIDNGIDADEAETVLQALGYILLDAELFPDKGKKISLSAQIQSAASRAGTSPANNIPRTQTAAHNFPAK